MAPGPLPRLFGLPWEQAPEPPGPSSLPVARGPVSVSPAPPAPRPAAAPDEYVFTMRQRRPNPVWLDAYKKRLAETNKVAAERTRHLKGAERVRAMNAVVRELMKAPRGP